MSKTAVTPLRRTSDRPAAPAPGAIVERKVPAGPLLPSPGPAVQVRTAAGWRNVRMMRLLERIAERFHKAAIPLMALKGAALNLVLLDHPDDRPMSDLDLLVRPEHVGPACRALESMGALRGEPLVREDFFPKYHYEIEYTVGTVYPVKIDLHVRPFRPLQYAQLVPDDALWSRSRIAPIGRSTIRIPGVEEMLIHLAVHAAVHGAVHDRWLRDIQLWIRAHQDGIDWEHLLDAVKKWGLALPVRRALSLTHDRLEDACFPKVTHRLARMPVGWRDRLVLWQAPRDAEHPVAQIVVNALTAAGLRFRFGYVRALVLPDRVHMADWYGPPHRGWLPVAYVLRWLGPIATRTAAGRRRLSRVELRPSPVHGVGIFAKCDIAAGDVIAQYFARPVEHSGPYVIHHKNESGQKRCDELMGRLRYLNHSCSPNARLADYRLIAVRRISTGHEITVDYGPGTCDCHKREYKPPHEPGLVDMRVA